MALPAFDGGLFDVTGEPVFCSLPVSVDSVDSEDVDTDLLLFLDAASAAAAAAAEAAVAAAAALTLFFLAMMNESVDEVCVVCVWGGRWEVGRDEVDGRSVLWEIIEFEEKEDGEKKRRKFIKIFHNDKKNKMKRNFLECFFLEEERLGY